MQKTFTHNGKDFPYTITPKGNLYGDGEIFEIQSESLKIHQDFYEEDINEALRLNAELVTQSHKEVSKTVTFRFPKALIDDFKALSKKDGLPYQTLIKSVLHQYVENRKN